MADYADWTESIELLGSEVMVPMDCQGATIMIPFDVQGATIMMPIDIQGQTLDIKVDINAQTIGNLSVDIKAQTVGNLNVNIAASAVTMNVNIAASAVTINMDIKAQTVAVKTQGEWSPQAGQHKQMTLYKGALTFGTVARADYSVTSGKNLYITHLSFMVSAQLVASGDLMQIGNVFLQNYASSAYYAFIGGNGGGGISFPTPIKVPGDQIVRLTCIGCANHTQELYAGWEGYEI